MIRTVVACIAVGLLAGSPAAGQAVFKSAHHDFRVMTVGHGLVNPWRPSGDLELRAPQPAGARRSPGDR